MGPHHTTPPAKSHRPSRHMLGGTLVVAALLGALVSSSGGCSLQIGPDLERLDASATPEDVPTATTSSDASVATDAATKLPLRGSPLCQANGATCFPDEGAIECGGTPTNTADAGYPDAGPAQLGDTCRVTLSGPSCGSAGAIRDGSECKVSSDCGAGSDCVLRADGMAQCRRYCCAGTCSNVGSPSGGATFCDVVQLAEESSVKVPVCLPVKACKLLGNGQCMNGETCAVAAEDGTTSCVPTGPARSGESCDETHCNDGLTCVGKPGARRCFQLCRVGGSTCGADLTCKTSSLIKDTTIGLCQPR